MTLLEISVEYRRQAEVLRGRIGELSQVKETMREAEERSAMEYRIKILQGIWREARDLAVLTERYYEKGYRRNVKYTL